MHLQIAVDLFWNASKVPGYESTFIKNLKRNIFKQTIFYSYSDIRIAKTALDLLKCSFSLNAF